MREEDGGRAILSAFLDSLQPLDLGLSRFSPSVWEDFWA